MSSVEAIVPHQASLRRAVLRLLVIVSVLMLLAGVPTFAPSASRTSRGEQELLHTVATLRQAIALYRSQHEGRLPDAEPWDAILRQLSQPTNLAGRWGGSLGPYLGRAWVEDEVLGPGSGRIVDELPAGPDGTSRWIWCRRTGELRCNAIGRDLAGTSWWDI